MRGLRGIALAVAFGFSCSLTYAGVEQWRAERALCIPADAVEEWKHVDKAELQHVLDAWYSVERCRDLKAPRCGEPQ